LDGEEGLVFVNPDEETTNHYRKRKEMILAHLESLQQLVDVPSVTLDGKEIELKANISSVKELEQALKTGARGVGLFRTEFLYMDRNSLPPEEEQFEVYKQVAEML